MGSINVVLYEPEIPQNTGNIMRTCVAANAKLHLIEPLGFSLDEKEIKRSGANYVKYLDYKTYKNWDEFEKLNINENSEMFFLTRYGQKHIYDCDAKDLNKDYYLVLGKESTGIPYDLLKKHLDKCIRLPMTEKVRALNVSNVAAIMVYELCRQQGFVGMSEYEPSSDIEGFKGKDFLLK